MRLYMYLPDVMVLIVFFVLIAIGVAALISEIKKKQKERR